MSPAELRGDIQALVAAFQAGRLDEAKTQADSILARAPGEPTTCQVLGAIYLKQARLDAAETILKAGYANAPDSAAFPNMLATAARAKGDLSGALAYLETAAMRAPDNPIPLENLGKVAAQLDQRDKARAAFEACLALAPDNADANLGLARIELAEGDAAKAAQTAARGLSSHASHPKLQHVLAEAELLLGHPTRAAELAAGLAASSALSANAKGAAQEVLAKALDNLGRYDEAFAAFTTANQLAQDEHAARIAHARTNRSVEVLNDIATVTPDLAARAVDWPRVFATPAPVFFMGFPRSGTTLVQRALTSHPLIAHTELDPFERAHHRILHAPDVAARLLALTPDNMPALRTAYWAEVERQGAVIPVGGVLLDWAPYDSQHLALIAMVFPDAKIIFAVRDPRDVVLSCFQQRFAPSRSAFEFLELPRAARFYGLTMTAAAAARAAFPLTIRDLRYDDVVADFEGELRALTRFMGVPWDDRVLAYRDRKDAADIKTPSATQVTQPVYTSALGKWRNYAFALEPVRPLLDPWAERWGYDL